MSDVPVADPSPAELAARVARLESMLRVLTVALAAVGFVALGAVVVASRMLHACRTGTGVFDTVSARRFLVKDGDSTRATFGMDDRIGLATLLVGPDDRSRSHVAIGEMGQVNVFRNEGRLTSIGGSEVVFVADHVVAAAFGAVSRDSVWWKMGRRSSHDDAFKASTDSIASRASMGHRP